MTACPDCGVEVGAPHDDGCDVARCLFTGGQRLSCFRGHGLLRLEAGEEEAIPGSGSMWCRALQAIKTDADRIPDRRMFVTSNELAGDPMGDAPVALCGCKADRLHDDCGEDIWTGTWPGEAECAEFGWWVLWRPGETPQWQPVPEGTPDASPDLNRLSVDARWDREQLRYVLR